MKRADVRPESTVARIERPTFDPFEPTVIVDLRETVMPTAENSAGIAVAHQTTMNAALPINAWDTARSGLRPRIRRVEAAASASPPASTRFNVLGTLASGGMGSVSLARMAGSAGFSRLVAIKRLHPELAAQREFVGMLVDEARLASSLRHANIVNTLDLEATDGGFSLILEYIEGVSLHSLLRASQKDRVRVPVPLAIAIAQGILRGLDAAHEARSADGHPLSIVHRDISPRNILVGVDGVPRIIDFGIAKAMSRVVHTAPGEVRGTIGYVAPELLQNRPATRQADVYSVGVVLWELLTGRRLFGFDDPRAACVAILRGDIKPPSAFVPTLPKVLDEIVLKAMESDLGQRFFSAREMLDALAPLQRATEERLGRWVRRQGAADLAKHAELLQNDCTPASRTLDELIAEAQPAPAPPPSLPTPAPISITPRPTTDTGASRAVFLLAVAIVLCVVAVVGALMIHVRQNHCRETKMGTSTSKQHQVCR